MQYFIELPSGKLLGPFSSKPEADQRKIDEGVDGKVVQKQLLQEG